MHQQSNRTIQECVTSLPVADVLASATAFFARGNGVYAAFIEQQGPTYVSLRGQGGEELIIGARAGEQGTVVTGSSYLFDQQIARFFDSLPLPLPVVPAPAVTDGGQAATTPDAPSVLTPAVS